MFCKSIDFCFLGPGGLYSAAAAAAAKLLQSCPTLCDLCATP